MYCILFDYPSDVKQHPARKTTYDGWRSPPDNRGAVNEVSEDLSQCLTLSTTDSSWLTGTHAHDLMFPYALDRKQR